MKGKQRLSASVDAELLHAAQTAVDEGRATSISAWVNDALRLKAEHDRRMQALDSFLAAYEAEHGVITEVEIDEALRRARSRATVVRSAPVTTAESHRGVA
jgi:Arc/MetJ-type ribon-helix-helix transcriptional regulator